MPTSVHDIILTYEFNLVENLEIWKLRNSVLGSKPFRTVMPVLLEPLKSEGRTHSWSTRAKRAGFNPNLCKKKLSGKNTYIIYLVHPLIHKLMLCFFFARGFLPTTPQPRNARHARKRSCLSLGLPHLHWNITAGDSARQRRVGYHSGMGLSKM